MATLTKLPCFLLLSQHKLFLNQPQQCQICLIITHHFIPQKRFRIYASSPEKTRGSRKVKSNAELCNEIREFVSTVGFPEGYLPSTKEFSDNGRTDLANIVRRRGYKLIRLLLANTPKGEVDGLNEEDCVAEGEIALSGVASSPTALNNLKGQEEKANDIAINGSSSSEVPISMDHSDGEVENRVEDRAFVAPSYTVKDCDESVKYVLDESSMHSHVESDSLTNSYLVEKAANFIQNGELDVIEDNISGIVHESSADEAGGLEHASIGTDSALTCNGSIAGAEGDQASAKTRASVDLAENLDVETSETENQVEVNQLKLMLHQKELELCRLKSQIEKEKLALAALQEKAEAEMDRARKLISEKDAELRAAEETMSGLVEVELQYYGDAETVDAAGSFNGWHHPFKMEPQVSSSTADSVGSRKSRVWSMMLWLYPGTYEIKFIVDGDWKINPDMEKVTKGGISNNILRVDR